VSQKQKRSTASVLRPNVSFYVATPKMLTVLEVCEYLRVSRATVYRLFRDRDIPTLRVSKRDRHVAVDDLARRVERESRALKFIRKA
jgi:excisionase family DNA binding protein